MADSGFESAGENSDSISRADRTALPKPRRRSRTLEQTAAPPPAVAAITALATSPSHGELTAALVQSPARKATAVSSSPRRSSPRALALLPPSDNAAPSAADAVLPATIVKSSSGLLGDAGIGDSSDDDEDTLNRELDDELDDDDDNGNGNRADRHAVDVGKRRRGSREGTLNARLDGSHDADVSASAAVSEVDAAVRAAAASGMGNGGSSSLRVGARSVWPPSPNRTRHWRAARRAHAAAAAVAQAPAAPAPAPPLPQLGANAAANDTPRVSDGGEGSSEIWNAGQTRIVELNVGGQYFATSSTTIAMHRESLLYSMVFGRFPSARDAQGRIFIDRDGTVFRYVLNFMREGRLSLPMNFDDFEALLWAAEFYQVRGLRHAALAQVAQVRRERLVRFLSLSGLDLSSAPLQGVDFEGCSLAGMNLRGAWLDGANLREADLRGADLREAQLQGACFDGALLDDAQLQNADLKHASLVGASLANAHCEFANLSDVRFTDALMTGASFSNANLMRTVFDNCGLAGCDMRGANLSESSMDGANVSECCLADATLIGTRLRSANARAVDFKGALIRDVVFESAVLVGAVFDQARVERCAFSTANMATCSLRNLDLRGSVFGAKGDLGAANLNHSDLTGAQLQGVNLRGVSFEGANLTSANFSGADTAGIKMQGAHRINTVGLKK